MILVLGWVLLSVRFPLSAAVGLRHPHADRSWCLRKGEKRPCFRVNGPFCGTGGISGTTHWRCPVARAGRRARTASAGGPRRNLPGFGRPFGCGFSALPWNVVSPPSEAPRLAFGRSWAILGLLQDRAGQTGEGITGRNQLAVLTLHGLFSHARQTRPQEWTRLSAAAIRGFDSGFGLGFVVDPLARSAAVFRKSFVFSYLSIRKGLILILGFWFPADFIHRFVAPTTCSLNYLIFNYLL